MKTLREEADEHANYCMRVLSVYLKRIKNYGLSVAGSRILELGPGISVGVPIVLAAFGARSVAVVDPYTCNLDSAFHRSCMLCLYEMVKKQYDAFDESVFDRVIDSTPQACVANFRIALEELQGVEEPFDIILSNAVLEHLYEPERGVDNLYNLTKSGGYGFHQVDFRDHRNFERPLDHLLMDKAEHRKIFLKSRGECASRLRPRELSKMFAASGFEILSYESTMFCEQSYFACFIKDYSRKYGTNLRDLQHLNEISAHYVVRRRGGSNVF